MTFDPSIMTRKCQYNCSPTQSPEAITTGFSLPIGWMLLLIHFIYDVTSNNLLQTVSPSYQPLLRVIFIQPTLLNNNVHTGPLPIVCLPFLNSLVRLLTVRTSLCSARPWRTGTHDGLLMEAGVLLSTHLTARRWKHSACGGSLRTLSKSPGSDNT